MNTFSPQRLIEVFTELHRGFILCDSSVLLGVLCGESHIFKDS